MGSRFQIESLPIDLQHSVFVKYSIASIDPNVSTATQLTLCSRHLVLNFPGELLACPRNVERTVLVVRYSVFSTI